MKDFKATLWAIVDKNDNVYYSTLSRVKKECIGNFISRTSLTWEETKKYGWNCIKVDVQIQSASNKQN